MHNSSLIVAGVLAVIAVALASQKSRGSKNAGMVFAGLSALMLVAGFTG